MNYLTEILAFYDWLESNPQITDTCICLWHALMYQANKTGWKSEFSVAISTLKLRTGLEKNAIYRARNKLKQFGVIDFDERSGNQSSVYRLNSFVSFKETHNGSQSEPQCETHNGSHNGSHSETINKQNKTKQNKTNTPSKSPSTGDEGGFDRFWAEYPRKQQKEEARKAFIKIKADEGLLSKMINALKQQKQDSNWTKDNGKYIPYPATWLNGKRWEDELYAPSHAEKEYKDFDEVFGNGN